MHGMEFKSLKWEYEYVREPTVSKKKTHREQIVNYNLIANYLNRIDS